MAALATNGRFGNLHSVNAAPQGVRLTGVANQATLTRFPLKSKLLQFGFNIAGTPDIPLVIEASADLAGSSWTPLHACTLTNGLVYFSDPQWTNHPRGFYRIRSP